MGYKLVISRSRPKRCGVLKSTTLNIYVSYNPEFMFPDTVPYCHVMQFTTISICFHKIYTCSNDPMHVLKNITIPLRLCITSHRIYLHITYTSATCWTEGSASVDGLRAPRHQRTHLSRLLVHNRCTAWVPRGLPCPPSAM